MQITTFLTALALFSTATSAPTLSTNINSLADRLIKLLKNPSAYVDAKPDSCARVSTGKYWSCGLGDYLDGNLFKYSATDMSAIISIAKTFQQTDVDMSKVKVTSEYLHWGNSTVSRGSYEMHGVFKRTRAYNVYLSGECLPTGNSKFPDKFKGISLGKFVSSPKALKDEFQKAVREAWPVSFDVPCVQVSVAGEETLGEDPDFQEQEANAQLAAVATF